MRRLVIAGAISAAGIAVGVFTVDVARDDPAFSFAGTSVAGVLALLAGGWALIGCGLAFWVRRPGSRFGPLLSAAGLAWFLLEWPNPVIGSALAFTVGLALYAACAPLAAHAVLAYPSGHLSSQAQRAALVAAYSGALLLAGVLPALFFDPQAQGCSQCPRNLLLVSDRGALAEDLTRTGMYVGAAWASALGAFALLKILRAADAARPILVAGTVYLGLVAAMYAVSIDRGFVSPTTGARRLWLAQAASLVGIVLGVGWAWLRARRARSEVARLVVDLARAPAPGRLREALREIVGDPELELAYPLDDRERLVDTHGRPLELSPRQERTSLIRDGRPVAVLAHAPGLLRDEQLVEEVTAAARLALENERLQAEVRSHLEELRASRARIVDAGDAERRRLERDLHDGAQQRLVALSLSLRLLRAQVRATADPNVTARLAQAETELREAIAELRDLARGIYPAALTDEGLGAAVEALAEEARVPIRIESIPEGRLEAAVESTAYIVVAEVTGAATSALAVRMQRSARLLAVEVRANDADGIDLVGLEDRVGAIDGSLAVERANGSVTIRAELPCAS